MMSGFPSASSDAQELGMEGLDDTAAINPMDPVR